jgi:hypothetical protein
MEKFPSELEVTVSFVERLTMVTPGK